jgi:hypothetical protein
VALIISQNVNRRHQTKGALAIAVALEFPEPAKLKRAGSPETGQPLTMVDSQRLAEARLVVRHTPALADQVLAGRAGRTAAKASLFSRSRGTFMCLICISIR